MDTSREVTAMNEVDNVFVTVNIHLTRLNPTLVPGDMVDDCDFSEAMSKADRFFHHIPHIPITWLITENLLDEFGSRFRAWHEEHGDEFAIMDNLYLPDASSRTGASYRFDLSYEEQVEGLAYLKQRFDEVIGQHTRALACGSINADTVRAME